LRLSLVPRTSEFYDLFTRAGANALETAHLVERRFREYPSSSVTQADVKEAERPFSVQDGHPVNGA
jgi:hypothetical protein